VPITGPIILGYTAHYGLGAMTPVREWVGVSREIVQKYDGLATAELVDADPRID